MQLSLLCISLLVPNCLALFRTSLFKQKSTGQKNVVDDPLKGDGGVKVQVGTPPQDFKLVVDSNSAESWIADQTCQWDCSETCLQDCNQIGCQTCCGSQLSDCPAQFRFVSDFSTTYKSNGHVWSKYDVTGFLGNDVVTLSGTGIAVKNATFVQAVYFISDDKQCEDCDDISGIFGIGFQKSKVKGIPSIFEQSL
ncbi:Eukaryotic aspartyl protease [Aphelenchoides besseyi]|nr:Eukaryotic aspartyl protease [Aphelenchoides besseyi]